VLSTNANQLQPIYSPKNISNFVGQWQFFKRFYKKFHWLFQCGRQVVTDFYFSNSVVVTKKVCASKIIWLVQFSYQKFATNTTTHRTAIVALYLLFRARRATPNIKKEGI
jgi:hypothetical protein